MFNSVFYPTTAELITDMIAEIRDLQGVWLEPSVGKCDIVKRLQALNIEVVGCENDSELQTFAREHLDHFLCEDFFELAKHRVSHIDGIIMNPPFSNQTDHILKAWDILPEGKQLISLCNYDSYKTGYSKKIVQLSNIIDLYGSIENQGRVFQNAERSTDVQIGMIVLYKPKSGENEFEDYFDTTDVPEQRENGLIKYDFITDIVGRVVDAVKSYDLVMSQARNINGIIKPIESSNIYFGVIDSKGNSQTREGFKKQLQKDAWQTIFDKLKLDRFLTNSVKEKINKFVEKQSYVPFTVKNVHKMLDVILQTTEQRMYTVITGIFDKITGHTHKNRFGLEGWKTNSEYIVNKTFILPNMIDTKYTTSEGKNAFNYDVKDECILTDLNKALCYITGVRLDTILRWSLWCQNRSKIDIEAVASTGEKYTYKREVGHYRECGKWHEWGFFEVKGFKKGSLHVRFKDESTWLRFNQIAANSKGFQLASKFTGDKKRDNKRGVNIYK